MNHLLFRRGSKRQPGWYGTDGMCGYAFQEKPAPAPFRTMFVELAEASVYEDGEMTLTEQAAVNTLPDFPEAYQAFLAELERLQVLGERAP